MRTAPSFTGTTFDAKKIRRLPDLPPLATHPDLREVQKFLARRGYLTVDPNTLTDGLRDETLHALISFQRRYGIHKLGHVDARTRELMTQPQCGLPDGSPIAFAVTGPWERRSLTFALGTMTSQTVGIAAAEDAVRRAFDTWSAAGAGLQFTEVGVSDDPDIVVEWRATADTDLDMSGSIIAHADFPPGFWVVVNALPLPLHFDDGEHTWVDGAVAGALDIESVALHEIGHLIGLAHSSVGDAVMFPSIGQGIKKRALHRDDIDGVRNLYPGAFVLQTGTPLHETDGSFQFVTAANGDLFAIKKRNTGSSSTEVHVLSAASGYQTFSLQTGTGLHETDDTFDFGLNTNRDLVAIKKSGTGSGTTEVHILSAASAYQHFSVQTGTALHETDGTFQFLVARNGDVLAIKKRGTGSGSTEVHVLSAQAGYSAFSLQTGTALHETDETFDFAVASNRDVYAIKRSATATHSTEIHVLAASGSYTQFAVQKGTALHETDDTFDFAVMPNRDVMAIKKSNTGTGSTEVHVLDL